MFRNLIVAAACAECLSRVEAVNVCVIGAGPSGIQAAKSAELKGYSTAIFEKEDYIGGRTKTTVYDGKRYPMGAAAYNGGKWSSLDNLFDEFLDPANIPMSGCPKSGQDTPFSLTGLTKLILSMVFDFELPQVLNKMAPWHTTFLANQSSSVCMLFFTLYCAQCCMLDTSTGPTRIFWIILSP